MNYHYFSPQPFYFNTPSTYAPFPAVAPPSTNIPSSSSLNYALLVKVHPHWNGRIAPFPGYVSSASLLPVTANKEYYNHGQLLQVVQQTSPNVKLDKYAQIYVPQYLRNIQLQEHYLHVLPPLAPFPPADYAVPDFYFRNMGGAIPDISEKCLIHIPPPLPKEPIPVLSASTYGPHWRSLLSLELDKIVYNKEQIVLWRRKFRVQDWRGAEFKLTVVGIRENYPWLEVGDIVQMREVLEHQQTGSSIAFEGRLTTHRKRLGHIYIRCPALKIHLEQCDAYASAYDEDSEIPIVFNVTFLTNAWSLNTMSAAAETMASMLKSPTSTAHGWLFPEREALQVLSHPTTLLRKITDWVDPGLNTEQRAAIESITLNHSSVPYLIMGPPGTGKTRTIVEAVLQILRVHEEACILLCTPSNPAADTLVSRLRGVLGPSEMLRLNDRNRTFAEVPVGILQYCHVEGDQFSLPRWEALLKYKVIVSSCLDADILVRTWCTNEFISSIEGRVLSTLHPHSSRSIRPHWTHLVIDEAAQGSEPELLIPLSVVALSNINSYLDTTGTTTCKYQPQIVLCGDTNQLGPLVWSERARDNEYALSLLERLLGCEIYKSCKSSEGTRLGISLLTRLTKNYRSHPGILMPPSALFYNDTLEPCAQNGTIIWSELPNPKLPLAFFGHEYSEEWLDEGATWFNTGELERVVKIVLSLLNEAASSSPPLSAGEIAVMAPWREQVWRLREAFRNKGLRDVDVGTIEEGRESRVVIISCVRSHRRFLEADLRKTIGIIFEKKRLNVAITRARELLVIVGNAKLLSCDPYWKGFIQFAIRRKLYKGPEVDIDMDGSYVSRLESQWFESNQLGTGIEEVGVLLAGVVAREILREEE